MTTKVEPTETKTPASTSTKRGEVHYHNYTPNEPTVEKWEREFDKEFVFQTGDWTELGGEPDHQEFIVEPKEIKDFIRTLLSHSVQEAKAEMAIRAVDECMKYQENPTYELRDKILASLKQEDV